MSDNTARQIIERAMADRSVYDAMAAREIEVWGRILPALERSEARVEDQKASAELRVSRYQASLVGVAKEKGLRFERGLTLGCGAGRLERILLRNNICQSFHGIDISEKAIADARETAKREGLSITYEVGDLNFFRIAAEGVRSCSRKTVTEIKTPIPGHLGSPFEKIQSEEIVPVFERHFTIEWKREFTAFLLLVAPPGTRAAYVENDDTKALFEILHLLDHLCVEEGIVKPITGQHLMRPNP